MSERQAIMQLFVIVANAVTAALFFGSGWPGLGSIWLFVLVLNCFVLYCNIKALLIRR